jgi:hypothetical protein
MKTLLASLMATNAGLFFFGAVQHAGFAIGAFHEPRIVPATIVESLCGFSLVWGAVTVLRRQTKEMRGALICNFIALCGVLLGIAALAVGAGPRTASNDLHHYMMLILIGASLLVVFFDHSKVNKS